MKLASLGALSAVRSLSVKPELEMAALQARAALVLSQPTHPSRNAAGISRFLQEAAVSGFLPRVTDFSACSSLEGPRCVLLGEDAVEADAVLDGVRFASEVLSRWDTMLSMP